MEAIAGRMARSSHIVLKRSAKTFILRPEGKGGTIEVSSWEQEYDYNSNVTKDEVIQPVIYSVGNETVDRDLMMLRFNMMSNLRHELNKAVESEAPEDYAARFTPAVRQAILRMSLSEIQIAAENGEKKNEKEEARVHGHCEFRGDYIQLQAQYSLFRTITDEDGIITVEHTHLGHDLSEAYFADAIEVTSKDADFGTLMRVSDEAREAVEEWEKTTKAEVGEEVYRVRIKEEIEKLKDALMCNEGTVHGQIRILTIDPRNGIYQYQFAQRIPKGALNNHTDHTVLEMHSENPQSPSCDELATLLSLAI